MPTSDYREHLDQLNLLAVGGDVEALTERAELFLESLIVKQLPDAERDLYSLVDWNEYHLLFPLDSKAYYLARHREAVGRRTIDMVVRRRASRLARDSQSAAADVDPPA